MNIALSLVALSVLGGTPRDSERPQSSVHVRVFEMPAETWRKDIYKSCLRVGRDGISTVWVLDEKTAAQLIDLAQNDRRARIVQAPRVTTFDGVSALVEAKQNRHFVSDVTLVKTVEKGVVKGIAFTPNVDTIEEGVSLSVVPSRSEDGHKLDIDLVSIWIPSVSVAPVKGSFTEPTGGEQSIQAATQLPQVVEAQVRGSFQVPSGRMLLVSLGSATVPQSGKTPILTERLALVDARPIIMEAEEERIGRVASVPRSLPKLPARSMPQPVAPNGTPVLVKDEAVQATNFDTVPAPRPSAQTAVPAPSALEPAYPVADLRVDPNVAPAKFEPVPTSASPLATTEPKPTPSKPGSLFPLFGPITIEIKINVGK